MEEEVERISEAVSSMKEDIKELFAEQRAIKESIKELPENSTSTSGNTKSVIKLEKRIDSHDEEIRTIWKALNPISETCKKFTEELQSQQRIIEAQTAIIDKLESKSSQNGQRKKNTPVCKVPLPSSGRYLQKVLTSFINNEEDRFHDFLVEIENNEIILTRI